MGSYPVEWTNDRAIDSKVACDYTRSQYHHQHKMANSTLEHIDLSSYNSVIPVEGPDWPKATSQAIVRLHAKFWGKSNFEAELIQKISKPESMDVDVDVDEDEDMARKTKSVLAVASSILASQRSDAQSSGYVKSTSGSTNIAMTI